MLRDGRGSVALVFAVMAGPLLALAGLAVDYALIDGARRNAQGAADAAALAALSPGTEPMLRKEAGRSAFLTQLAGSYQLKSIAVDVEVTETASAREALVTYSIEMPLYFSGLFGKAGTTFTGRSVSTIVREDHVDIRFWLDDSASMGVAATEADRDRLRIISRDDPSLANCAFACHLPTNMKPGRWTNTLDRARDMGVKIRLDVMMENVSGLMATVLADAHPDQRIRFQVAALSKQFRRLTGLTTDVARIQRRLARFRPSGTNHGESASRLGETIPSGLASIPRWRGRGTLNRPRQFVVLVTDGMQFDWNNLRPGPIDSEVCDAMKERGVSVAVVQLRYVALDGDSAFEHWVRPHLAQIGPALEACASPGMFFSGDTPDQIREAFHRLAESLNRSLRIKS